MNQSSFFYFKNNIVAYRMCGSVHKNLHILSRGKTKEESSNRSYRNRVSEFSLFRKYCHKPLVIANLVIVNCRLLTNFYSNHRISRQAVKSFTFQTMSFCLTTVNLYRNYYQQKIFYYTRT